MFSIFRILLADRSFDTILFLLDLQMGYGTRALTILEKYFEGKIPPMELLEEKDGSVDGESAEESDLLHEKIG